MAEIIKAGQSSHRYRIELWLLCGFVTASLIAVVWAAVTALGFLGWSGPMGLVSFAFGLAALLLWLWAINRLSFVVGRRAAVREACNKGG
jgi:hypothetical protein